MLDPLRTQTAVIVGVMVLALAVVMIFPQIALWLPDYVYGK